MSKDNKERSGKPFATQVEGSNLDVVMAPKEPAPPTVTVPETMPVEDTPKVTITVGDKGDAHANIPAEPTGSKRLAAEQAAGKASLERKHGPGQLASENEAGKKAASKGK